MVLPGVPRSKRIVFVHKLIRLLLEDGIDGITKKEYDDLSAMIQNLLDSITVDSETKEKNEEPEDKPGSC